MIHDLGFSLHQVLGYIAKGSFGPILKVKDKAKQKTYAVKVSLTFYMFIRVIKAMNKLPVVQAQSYTMCYVDNVVFVDPKHTKLIERLHL